MDARWGWTLATLVMVTAAWQFGWRGLALGATVVVFWLVLQFSRSLRVMKDAGGAPMGSVANAVMFHAKLQAGWPMLKVLPLAGSLGRKVSDDPETWAWQDASGDSVELVFEGGRLARWQLVRVATS